METASGSLTASRHTVLSLLGRAADHLRSRGFDEARLHGELLLAHVLGISRLDLYLQFDRPLTSGEVDHFRALFLRRLTHEPLQYILGETEFMGLRLTVDSNVLIPRPETELLVERALEFCARGSGAPWRILDACTGSGNIAVALAVRLPSAHITAVDVSPGALRVAGDNVARHAPGRVDLVAADLLTDPLPGGAFHLLVSNPPYVPLSEFPALQPEVRDFEPSIATTDGGDGLRFHRRLVELARERLEQGGALIMEIGFGQAAAVREICAAGGLMDIEVIPDYAGIARVVQGVTP